MTDPIQTLRKYINLFKQPYLLGVTEGGIVNAPEMDKTDEDIQSMDNYSEAHKNICAIHQIITDTIRAGGVPPPTDDINTKSVNAVFEKGVYSKLREDPSLKDEMLYYAKLDLLTYPDTLSQTHIDEQNENNIVPAVNNNPIE